MIVHQIEALVAAGVTDIVLAVNYRPEVMEKFLAEVGNLSIQLGLLKIKPDPVFRSMKRSITSTSNSRSSPSPSIPPAP